MIETFLGILAAVVVIGCMPLLAMVTVMVYKELKGGGK